MRQSLQSLLTDGLTFMGQSDVGRLYGGHCDQVCVPAVIPYLDLNAGIWREDGVCSTDFTSRNRCFRVWTKFGTVFLGFLELRCAYGSGSTEFISSGPRSKDFGLPVRNQYGVFKMGGHFVIFGDHGPIVVEDKNPVSA